MKTEELYELTTPQKSIWKIESFFPNTNINNIAGSLKIDNNVNYLALEKAFNLIILENEAFRLNFTLKNAIPYQYINNYTYFNIDIIDINTEEEFTVFKNNFINKCFNTINTNLFYVKLLRMYDGSGYMFLSTHHLISDGYSMSLFINQIYNNYISICSNEVILPSPKPSYLDFIKNNSNYLLSEKFFKARNYWEEQFCNLPSILNFKKSLNTSSISCSVKKYTIDSSLMSKIKIYCSNNNISENIFFLAIFSIYLNKIFDKDNFIIGNPSLNRSNFKEKQTFGMFVSIMPFIVNINTNLNFTDFCKILMHDQKKMYRHLTYPYQNILNFVKEKHNTTLPLYDFVFSFQNFSVPSYCKWINSNSQLESLQVHIKNISSESDSLTIHYHFLDDIFSIESINIMNDRILFLIDQILENNNTTIHDISILSNTDKLLLDTFNSTDYDYNKNSNIVHEFEKVATLYPDNIAIKDSNKSLTYKELNNRSNIVAKYISSQSIDSDIIAFSKERSIDIVIIILGILKSGHTYMPIDPEYPINRISYMLNNSGCKLLITSKNLNDQIFNKYSDIDILLYDTIELDQECSNLSLNIPSDKLCYIMYTSGSTGDPKAVSIKHYNVLNFTKSVHNKLNYNSNDTVISVTTVCFDIFVFELFPTLLSGMTLFMTSELEAKSPKLLSSIIINNNISRILTTPSRIDLLFEDITYLKSLSTIKQFLLGGEPLPKNFLLKLKKHTNASIVNLYGPTETTVYSTLKDLTHTTDITIGTPIYNTKIFILDKNNVQMPIGCIGEICISGDGVGNGYYNNHKKTSEVFIPNPYGNDLIYKTGDLGFFNNNGEIVCLGRKDNQIKIRGYRIELDDINSNILKFDGILKCVVVDKIDSNDQKYLCAYYTCSKQIDINKLKIFLLDSLPNYMIPTYFINLESFPLTINHKIDKKSLPDPTLQSTDLKELYIEPSNDIQKILCSVFCDSLNLSQLSINKDVFDYNLDSLNIINVQTKLLDFGIQLNTQDFYRHRTVENISNIIEDSNYKKNHIYDKDFLSTLNNSFNKHSNSDICYTRTAYSNILLTGATGYLGIHLLHDLLQKSNSILYCLIRNTSELDCKTRLCNLYKSYFNTTLDLNRVKIISSEITETKLGLSDEMYENLSNKINLVINCAANVKYYGNYSDFKKINIDVVSNIINFCTYKKIKFVHISTLGVSGNFLINNEKNRNIFCEDDFFIGQHYRENVYIQTKFEAESLIYSSASSELDFSIIRVGNLTSRFSDGVFQHNFENNAFYNILLIILKYGIIPDTMLNQFLEFTPVDYCASAITKLIFNVNLNKFVFHLFNNNYLNISDLLTIFKTYNYTTTILPGKFYKEQLLFLSKQSVDKNILKGVVNDLDENLGLSFISTVNQQNNFTNLILNNLGFNWPSISCDYIEKILDYLKSNKYL